IFAIVAASVPALAADPPAQAPAPTAPAPAAPATATPVSAATKELLDRIGSGDAAAADALYKTAPKVVAELATFLARPHATAANDRRELLLSFGADVPDEKGRFAAPKRKSA